MPGNQTNKQTSVPPPPLPEVAVRTMASDIHSVAAGEIEPQPEIVTPPGLTALTIDPHANSRKNKPSPFLWVAITLGALITLGLVGYFVVYPLLVTNTEEQPTQPPDQNPPITAPPITSTHQSAFVLAPAAKTTASFNVLSHAGIKTLLTSQGQNIPEGALIEVIVKDGQGGAIPPDRFFAMATPDFTEAGEIKNFIKNDFTAFLYKTGDTAWPGYLFPLQDEYDDATLTIWLDKLEKTNLNAFYLTPVENFAPFKEGQIKTIPIRFAQGNIPNAVFVYGATNKYLLFSTNLEGAKEAIRLLGI